MFKAKGKRQKAKGKNIKPIFPVSQKEHGKMKFSIFAFGFLPFAF
jgi:hypothetical protein